YRAPGSTEFLSAPYNAPGSRRGSNRNAVYGRWSTCSWNHRPHSQEPQGLFSRSMVGVRVTLLSLTSSLFSRHDAKSFLSNKLVFLLSKSRSTLSRPFCPSRLRKLGSFSNSSRAAASEGASF